MAPARTKVWFKPVATLIVLLVIARLAPVAPLDPWSLFSPDKIAKMVLALAAIQVLGSALSQYLGARTGAILTGFFGGVISSTATTASLARRSKTSDAHTSGELLVFLSATGAMLFEGLVLVITGTAEAHFSHVLIFAGPILATLGMILVQYRKHGERTHSPDTAEFQILSILKLSLLIVVILSVSKAFQHFFGQNGLLVLTSLVSFFEVHGSIVANVQLHESGSVSIQFLCNLVAASVVASYLSKLFLISVLGSAALRNQAIKRTMVLFCALALSWVAAVNMG